jgi:hypothetical protein
MVPSSLIISLNSTGDDDGAFINAVSIARAAVDLPTPKYFSYKSRPFLAVLHDRSESRNKKYFQKISEGFTRGATAASFVWNAPNTI